MKPSDYDNDAIAELVRDVFDGVTVEGEPVEFVAMYCVAGVAIETVNIIASPAVGKDRLSDILAMAQQVNDSE